MLTGGKEASRSRQPHAAPVIEINNRKQPCCCVAAPLFCTAVEQWRDKKTKNRVTKFKLAQSCSWTQTCTCVPFASLPRALVSPHPNRSAICKWLCVCMYVRARVKERLLTVAPRRGLRCVKLRAPHNYYNSEEKVERLHARRHIPTCGAALSPLARSRILLLLGRQTARAGCL